VSEPDPFDRGLQPERTQLAWRRTVISMALGALVSLRLLPPVLGPWSFGVGIAGLVGCAVFWVLAARRARWTRRPRPGPPGSPGSLPGGGLLLGLGLVVAAAGAVGLLAVALVPGGPPGP
jgi:hypothetical protein